jgi:hypothetical protein
LIKKTKSLKAKLREANARHSFLMVRNIKKKTIDHHSLYAFTLLSRYIHTIEYHLFDKNDR